MLYVVTSLLVPAVIAAVPLITDNYQLSTFHSYCYIYSSNGSYRIELAERLALWDVPAIVILLASSVTMVILLIRIANLLCRKLNYEPIINNDWFWKVLKQLLPLLIFPILYFIFIIPALAFHLYAAKSFEPDRDEALIIAAIMFISLWSMASGAALIIHLSLSRCFSKTLNRSRVSSNSCSELQPTGTASDIYSS